MSEESRHVGFALMVGLVSLPIVFVWLLFRRGYADSLRRAALVYALAIPGLTLVGHGVALLVGG